jgi:hypothetical protein
MPTHRHLPDELSRWSVQALTRLFATYAIAQGVIIVMGGAERWRGAALAVAMQVPGAPATWGIALGVFGVLALGGTFLVRLRLTALALWLIGAWCMFFAISQLLVVVNEPTAATTGIGTYTVLAVAASVLAVTYRRAG